MTDSFEKLLASETIEVNITENLTYENLTDSEENLWSVLYLTGYLTKDIKNPVSGNESIFKNPKCRDYGYFQEKRSALV